MIRCADSKSILFLLLQGLQLWTVYSLPFPTRISSSDSPTRISSLKSVVFPSYKDFKSGQSIVFPSLRGFPVWTVLQGFSVWTVLQGFPVWTVLQGFPVWTVLQGFPVWTVLRGFPVWTVLQGFPVWTVLRGFPSSESIVFPSYKDSQFSWPMTLNTNSIQSAFNSGMGKSSCFVGEASVKKSPAEALRNLGQHSSTH